jgi:hypothetical protein
MTRGPVAPAEMLAFQVLPEEAIRRWSENAARSEPEDAWEDPLVDPSAEADLERLFFFGIGVGDEVRERLAAALPLDRVPFETLAWFLTEVSDVPLEGPGRGTVFQGLEDLGGSFTWDPTPLVPLLVLLEVRDRDRVVELLCHWVEHREGELRTLALRLLGRLGDTTHVTEIRWPTGSWPGCSVTAGPGSSIRSRTLGPSPSEWIPSR